MPVDPVRVLVTGYPTLFLDGIREILTKASGIRVVGEATTAGAAAAMARVLRPEVVLLDIDMPDTQPADAVRSLRSLAPESRVLVLSTHEAFWLVHDMSSLDVRGYLLKSISRHELVATVLNSRADNGYLTLSISRSRLTQLNRGTPELLSKREKDVLSLVSEALSNAQIASSLDITEGTVKRHLRNIFVKLGAVSRIDAVNKGIAGSLISAPNGRRAQ